MKVGFTGSQYGTDMLQEGRLVHRLTELRPSCLVHGGCIGADDRADYHAAKLGILRVIFPSTVVAKRVKDYVFRSREGSQCIIMPPMPPLERNHYIVDSVQHLLACPRQRHEVLRSGTWATVRYARKKLGTNNVELLLPEVNE